MTTPTLPMSPTIAAYSPKVRNQAAARRFVSRGGYGYVSIMIFDGRDAVDPDDELTLKVWYDDTVTEYLDSRGELIVSVDLDDIQSEETGKFYYELGPGHTSRRGLLHAEWTYTVEGLEFTYRDDMQILDQMPIYESLSEVNKAAVESVWYLFADMFDSENGGPWLTEQYQSHFDYERIAQLMTLALTRFNLTGSPLTEYGLGVDDSAIPANYQGLIVWGTYLEVIRHLVRSYVEQPEYRNMGTTYTDRQQYMQRWQMILEEEKPLYRSAVIRIKRKQLGLSKGSILVEGGFWGRSNGIFKAGMTAMLARGARFYPAAAAVSFGGTVYGGK
jgi:hypothetical protein